MMQISGTNNYAGVFLLSASPMTLEISDLLQNDWSKITFRVNGPGPLEFFIFYGPTFDQVVRQYQDVVGRPKVLPLWAHGFFSMSPAYKDSKLALEAIEGYK